MNIRIFPERFGALPYVFLVYLFMPAYILVSPINVKNGIGLGILFMFLVTYRQLYFSMGKQAYSYWLAVQMLIVFIFGFFYQPNMLFMGFFPANFIGWYGSDESEKRKFKIAFVCLVLIELIPLIRWGVFSSPFTYIYFFPFLLIMFMSPFGIRSMNKRMELEEKLDQANEQIKVLVKREERVRIARDLHDTLGHTLSLITLKSQLVEKLISRDTNRAEIEAKEIERISRTALKQVRELVSNMRAITIAEELIQIQEILKAANITYNYKGESDLSEIPPLTQNIIGMCLREAITNVVKHSQAKNCTVTILLSKDHIHVEVKDDGIGIGDRGLYSNGLKGISERLAFIDGTCKLSNQNGTLLAIMIPIVQKEGAFI
ncbi:sensor histidine kinase [Hazenella coriacea]|nr:sensor histidine kinase [Hazenella coriacea]